MLSWLKRILRRFFRKRVKPVKNPKHIELVGGGFVPAPDYMCVKMDMFENKNGKGKKVSNKRKVE
jgi:hypothetical protein